jgi:hypothetical protein
MLPHTTKMDLHDVVIKYGSALVLSDSQTNTISSHAEVTALAKPASNSLNWSMWSWHAVTAVVSLVLRETPGNVS